MASKPVYQLECARCGYTLNYQNRVPRNPLMKWLFPKSARFHCPSCSRHSTISDLLRLIDGEEESQQS